MEFKDVSEETIICRRCHHIFRLTSGSDSTEKPTTCRLCGGTDIAILPPWAPTGSEISEAVREWEYQCQQCLGKFKLPVPDSPSRERDIRCPLCGSGHIHRMAISGYAPLYCG